MTDASDFPDPDYVELFGITRADLDMLSEAQQQADSALIGLKEWRATYNEVLDKYPGVETSIEAVLDSWLSQCSTIWFRRGSEPIPEAWAGLSDGEREERAQALMTDVSGLHRPPADEDLHRLFAEADERERAGRARVWPEFGDHYANRKQQVVRWIVETDGVVRDPWSGLPSERIDGNRWADDEVLERVPIALRAATARKWLDSAADERKFVGGVANGPPGTESDWKATHALASLAGTVLSEFLKWLAVNDDPSAAAVMHEWHNGNLPLLVQEYLDDRS